MSQGEIQKSPYHKWHGFLYLSGATKPLQQRIMGISYYLWGGFQKHSNLNFSQNIAHGGMGVTRGSRHVRADQRRKGLVDVKLFHKLFLVHTHTITGKAARSGMVHSGRNIFFTHFSMLSLYQYPHGPKNKKRQK